MNAQNESGAAPAKPALLGSIRNTLPILNSDDKIERFRLQAMARELLPDHRIQTCLRRRVSLEKPVRVMMGSRYKKSYYSNVMRCGSVWACPVCAAKITTSRAARLLAALQDQDEPIMWEAKNGRQMQITPLRYHVLMATYTISHRAHSSLAYVASKLLGAYHKMWSGRWAVHVKQTYNIFGMAKALEVTHGASGWHPHLHVLIVIDGQISNNRIAELDLALFGAWDAAVVSQGGYINEHGFDLVRADYEKVVYTVEAGLNISQEIDKYGGVDEITRYPIKMARGDNKSLMQLLQAAANGDDRAPFLWTEAQAYLAGKRQLRTSPSIQSLIDAKFDLDDDESMVDEDAGTMDTCLASLTTEEWTAIVQQGCRGGVLEIANSGDVAALMEYIGAVKRDWSISRLKR